MTKVELTRVHYYDNEKLQRNVEIATISRQLAKFDHRHRNAPIIKRNVFGRRWVLKINDPRDDGDDVGKRTIRERFDGRRSFKFVLYVTVMISLLVAVAFGVYFTLESYIVPNGTTPIVATRNRTGDNGDVGEKRFGKYESEEMKNDDRASTIERHFCDTCESHEVCMKVESPSRMACATIRDAKDPTGCGGLCKINTQHCKLLDAVYRLYVCKDNKNLLKCAEDQFNCGNMCVNRTKRCDGVINCSNKSDEFDCPCDLTTHFQCGNGTSCLDARRKCDGTIDCWDKSDEINCFAECQIDEIMCNNKQCIKSEAFCDGHNHCLDNSDEPVGCEQ